MCPKTLINSLLKFKNYGLNLEHNESRLPDRLMEGTPTPERGGCALRLVVTAIYNDNLADAPLLSVKICGRI